MVENLCVTQVIIRNYESQGFRSGGSYTGGLLRLDHLIVSPLEFGLHRVEYSIMSFLGSVLLTMSPGVAGPRIKSPSAGTNGDGSSLNKSPNTAS